MRVAIIKDGPFLPIKDGASYKIHSLSLEYQKNNLEVFFILIDRGWVSQEEIKNSGIDNFLLISPESVYDSSKITCLLNYLKIECVQTNIPELILSKAEEWNSFHIIFDSHDVLYEQAIQKSQSKEIINTKKFIDYAAGTVAKTIFCCTERDKKMYVELGLEDKKIFVIRNGTKITSKCCIDKEKSVVFIGHMFYEPNYEAVINLFNIAESLPEVKFFVIGNYPEILESKKPINVNLLGYIKDIEPVLKRLSVAIAPIDTGSGSRIKILDYLASGLKVISSTVGAAGLEDLHKHMIIEDNYNNYPEIILSQLKDHSSKEIYKDIEDYRFENIGKYASEVIKSRLVKPSAPAFPSS